MKKLRLNVNASKAINDRRYGLGKNQSMAQKMARVRARIKAGSNYVPVQHPDVAKVERKEGYLSPRGRKLVETMFDANSPLRQHFTVYELEVMYLGLVTLMAFYGGNKSLAARDCGFSPATISRWIKQGRMSPLGADIVGRNIDIPFGREDMRPDMSTTAWYRFDQSKRKHYARKEIAQFSSGVTRIQI